MAALEKSRLRNCLRKLRALAATLGDTVDQVELAQEMLDFLAVQAGLKPVYLLGRGLDDPRWVEGVLALARTARLQVIEGPFWDATPFGDAVPAWYTDDTLGTLAGMRAWYICRAPAVAQAVRRICAEGGRPTIEEEAALLGYPECCVAGHYRRALAWHRAILSILARRAEGDDARMKRLLADSERLEPETEAERAAFTRATALRPAPFGSWNMCDECAAGGGASVPLSARYRALAEAIDRDWAALLALSA